MASNSGQSFIKRNRPPRVHIFYEDPFDAEQKVELPFVMGVMADLSGDSPGVEKSDIDERKFLDIDMSDILVETVANKLTTVSYDCLEKAMRLTKSSGHRHLEILHWLYYLARDENTDFIHILRHFGIDVGEVHGDLQKAIAELKINQTELPSMVRA